MQQRCASLLAGKRTAYTRIGTLIVILLICGVPSLAMAQDAAAPDSGDTAWMLTSTALVLFMTIPGLALFYGGLVRVQNVLSVLMQCFALTGLITIVWIICGYSLAFNTAGMEAGKNYTRFFRRWTRHHVLAGCRRRLTLGDYPRNSIYYLPIDVCDYHTRIDRWSIR